MPLRTLQYQLQHLVNEGRVVRDGAGRAAMYRPHGAIPSRQRATPSSAAQEEISVSESGSLVRTYIQQPAATRRPVSYEREFLDAYRPNVTFYLSAQERALLAASGKSTGNALAAGTYAKQILSRLLIDLSWNSSRLEGNPYSLIDTKRLIEEGIEADGRGHLEAQMILNHKDAIEFLVRSIDEVGFNRHTIRNLHGLLANNLLPDPEAIGRLRHIP